MVYKRYISGRIYYISNESKVAFTAGEWNDAETRYRRLVASKLAERV